MDEDSLIKHLNYELFFEIMLEDKWDKFIIREIGNYSNGMIDNRFNFDVIVDMIEKPNGEIGFFNITPHNKYTILMLKLNKKGILRYHKLEKLINIK